MKLANRALRTRLPVQAWTGALLVSALVAGGHAQTTPTPPYGIGDALKEVQPPRPPEPPRPAAPVIDEPDARTPILPAGETLVVQSFKLEGAELIDEKDLQAVLEPYRQRALTMAEIERAADALTALYRSRGYLLARAYVPRQDARSGSLRIRIVVGKVGQITLHNRSLVRDGLVARAFAPLQRDEAVSRGTLERSMLIVSDFPGASLPKLTLSPGDAAGQTDIDIDVDEAPRFGGYALADNDGSRYTGRNRLTADLHVDSMLGLADRLSVHGLSSQNGDLLNGRLAYGLPLGADGLRAEVAVAKTTYTLGSDYQELGATGNARSVEATLSYPLQRSRSSNLALSLNLAVRHMRDDIGVSDSSLPKKARVATAGLQYEQWGGWLGPSGYTKLWAGVTFGHLDITDPTQRTANTAGANTVGDYGRLNLALEARADLTPSWNLGATLSVQQVLADRNLDISEQMNIAGGNGVRAYRESVSGDNGYLVNLDARYALPASDAFTHTVGPFADLGRVRLQNGSYATETGTRLSDLGLGYALNYQSMFARLDWAHAVGARPPATPDGKDRVLLRVGLVF